MYFLILHDDGFPQKPEQVASKNSTNIVVTSDLYFLIAIIMSV